MTQSQEAPIRIGHLYGNLLNTYGDNGNLLMLQYLLKKRGLNYQTEVNSLEETLSKDQYDFILFGGGQDFEQSVVAKNLPSKALALKEYIESDGVLLAICGGFQLLGDYYITAAGQKIQGASLLNHYTERQDNHRFIGDITIHNDEFNEDYVGYENHNGMTFIKEPVKSLGKVISGNGNNGQDGTEGARYKNVFCSYFHGPLLVRNPHLADHLIDLVLKRRQEQA
ncbi:adenosylcobyric acid synthase [Atopobacter sp. AH10]|uniref:type 1 glutamine amidotransferase n=1 Tax=Atopobacter sp. AH10 TaxID=2315861 RepID=UPI000EF1A68E|nr:adenosylcobyric acid synthase [Atopobacter sp. AH10]RLK64100.1 adenosylcobyric acid synthase [Atopobacter sp. AH10]